MPVLVKEEKRKKNGISQPSTFSPPRRHKEKQKTSTGASEAAKKKNGCLKKTLPSSSLHSFLFLCRSSAQRRSYKSLSRARDRPERTQAGWRECVLIRRLLFFFLLCRSFFFDEFSLLLFARARSLLPRSCCVCSGPGVTSRSRASFAPDTGNRERS